MSDIIRTFLPWVMSAVTIYTMFAAGEMKKHTWLVGLCNQVLWATWIITTASWGLLPMTLAITFVYARNHFKWAKKEAA